MGYQHQCTVFWFKFGDSSGQNRLGDYPTYNPSRVAVLRDVTDIQPYDINLQATIPVRWGTHLRNTVFDKKFEPAESTKEWFTLYNHPEPARLYEFLAKFGNQSAYDLRSPEGQAELRKDLSETFPIACARKPQQ